nr:THAP domain-containing protein 2-like [Parasteatoda tepidariorum]
MVMCIASGCKHYNQRDTCRFFRTPADPKVQKIWIRNVRRDDIQISKNHVICQCHFKDGLKANGPTLFEHNKDKIFRFPSPEKVSKKR